MKNQAPSIILQAVYAYVSAVVLAMIFSPLFGKLYILLFNPIQTGGLSGYENLSVMVFIQNVIFALPFLVPLLVVASVSRKQWLVWLIGVFIPFFIFLVGGSKYLLWFLIFTLAGGLVGWGIKMLMRRFKKA